LKVTVGTGAGVTGPNVVPVGLSELLSIVTARLVTFCPAAGAEELPAELNSIALWACAFSAPSIIAAVIARAVTTLRVCARKLATRIKDSTRFSGLDGKLGAFSVFRGEKAKNASE